MGKQSRTTLILKPIVLSINNSLLLLLQIVFCALIHTSIKCKFSVDSDIAVSPDLVHKCEAFLTLFSVPVSSYASNKIGLFSV